MSCSNKYMEELKAITCEDLPERKASRLYALVDKTDALYIGKSDEECKMVIIACIHRSDDYLHLRHITPDSVILLTPDQVAVHDGVHGSKTPPILKLTSMLKSKEDIDKLSMRPSASELRDRDQQYRLRQRAHKRG
jgi:hypothetical protein